MKRALLLILGLSGCTNAKDTYAIRCYSGGTLVYEALASGHHFLLNDTYWSFDTLDGGHAHVIGNCVAEYTP